MEPGFARVNFAAQRYTNHGRTKVDQTGKLQVSAQDRVRRSMGVKLLVVCGLALIMTIPALFVSSLVDERTSRAADVVKEISSHVGGQQTFLGPTLAIPYSIPAKNPADDKHGVYLVFPARAEATMKTSTEERRRSLFKVPVFKADLKMDAAFDLAGVPAAAPYGAALDWDRAEIIVGVSDARGALADAAATIDGKAAILVPAHITPGMMMAGEQSQKTSLALFGTAAGGVVKPGAQFNVTSQLKFSGAQRIAMLAFGKTTHLAVEGDWPSPGFDGGFLPINRTLTGRGFSAEWSVPFMARGVGAEGTDGSIRGLDATALGTSFIEVADPYQSVTRSLKYIPLFLGLVFLSYFVFEVTAARRVHPAQYLLVGVAQLIFYLLLLSLAERTGFDFAFLLAGVATVLLLATNTYWIFSSRLQGFRALGIFGLLYTLIYLLLRLEDDALLVGAIASFTAVAAVMYFTRHLDWYGYLPAGGSQDITASSGSVS